MDKYFIKIIKNYNKLGKEGLSSLTNEKKTNDLINFLIKFIHPKDNILEVACGYGRISNKLGEKGLNFYGIDLSPKMIDEAKKTKFKNRYKLGDMRNLKFPDNYFNVYLNLWFSFNYLLTKEDQIKTLIEAYRILDINGIGIIELLYIKNKKKGKFCEEINGVKVENYYHNINSLRELCIKAKIKKYKIKIINYSSNPKLFLFFKK